MDLIRYEVSIHQNDKLQLQGEEDPAHKEQRDLDGKNYRRY